MPEENKPVERLTVYESESIRAARTLLARKPEAVLRYLCGDQPPNHALIALALSAQLEVTKQKLETMRVTTALCRFLNLDKDASTTNNVEDKNGQDASPRD